MHILLWRTSRFPHFLSLNTKYYNRGIFTEILRNTQISFIRITWRDYIFFSCVCVYLSLCEFIMLKCESCIVSVTCISNIYAPIIHKQQYYNESISKTYFLLLIHQQFFRQLKNANWTDSFRCVLVNKIIALGFQEYLITRISSSASFKFNAYSQLIVNETGFFFLLLLKNPFQPFRIVNSISE